MTFLAEGAPATAEEVVRAAAEATRRMMCNLVKTVVLCRRVVIVTLDFKS